MSLLEHKNLSESYPAVPASVTLARNAVTAFADYVGVPEDRIDAIRLAASEALTNVVLHAYRGEQAEIQSGRVHVAAALTRGELWVLIADDGCGLRPRIDSPGLGVGLALIAQATDDFTVVQRSEGGTELRMRFSLDAADVSPDDQSRGSRDSAIRPASARFSTTV